jgi:hypothetical protein
VAREVVAVARESGHSPPRSYWPGCDNGLIR